MRRHARGGLAGLTCADVVGDLSTVDTNPRLAANELDARVGSDLAQRCGVVQRYAEHERLPRDRAVHGAGVDEGVAEALR
jgi:hypothetical protein